MTDTVPAPLCFVDVETDGLHQGRRIWEYAIIRHDFTPAVAGGAYDVKETVHHSFVGIDIRNSDPYGLNVGGFWDRHPVGRKLSGKPPTPADLVPCQNKHDAARDIMRATFGAHLVGVNPAFDADTFEGLLRAEGYLPAWDYHLEDLVAETVGYLRARLRADRHLRILDLEHVALSPENAIEFAEAVTLPWKSDRLAAAAGVEPAADSERHTALGDARWAQRWHYALAGA